MHALLVSVQTDTRLLGGAMLNAERKLWLGNNYVHLLALQLFEVGSAFDNNAAVWRTPPCPLPLA